MKYFVYLETYKERGVQYKTRRYYRRKIKHPHLTYVGTADVTDEYFIVGSETSFSNIIDLNQVVLKYRATLKGGTLSTFEHTLQELLVRAKEGILPYVSFAEHQVHRKPKIIIESKKHFGDG